MSPQLYASKNSCFDKLSMNLSFQLSPAEGLFYLLIVDVLTTFEISFLFILIGIRVNVNIPIMGTMSLGLVIAILMIGLNENSKQAKFVQDVND